MPGVKNPMCNAFPRIGETQLGNILVLHLFFLTASCDYWRYGAGGRQENINAICILNLNIINDKVRTTCFLFSTLTHTKKFKFEVFLILWWWFYLIALLSCIRVVYRCLQCR